MNIGNLDLGAMLVNLSDSFNVFRAGIFAVAALSGFYYFCKGLYLAIELSKSGQSGQVRASQVWANIFLGAIISAFTYTINGAWMAWASSPSNLSIVAYDLPSQAGAPAVYKEVISAALGFVQLVGYAFALYALYSFKKLSDGASAGADSSLIKAWTHFIGGLCAINIGPFLEGVASLAFR